jgi:hypothetical protein
MTIDEARELAHWPGLGSAPEYLRALLVVVIDIRDRLEAPAPPVAPVSEPAPKKPNRNPKG